MIAELEDPYILIHEAKLTGLRRCRHCWKPSSSGRPLRPRRGCRRRSARDAGRQPPAWRLEGRAVKAPGFGDRRKAMLQDIAVLTVVKLFLKISG